MTATAKKLLKLIFQLIIGVILILGIGFITVSQFSDHKIIKPYVVQSGSMEPALKLGGVVFSVPQNSYNPGDIITFAKDGNKENLVTHRVNFKLYPDGVNSDPVYKTSGDANEEFDRWEVKQYDIVGKVVFSIPYVGYAVDFAKRPYGFLLFVIVPATIIIYEELKVLSREFYRFLKKYREDIRIKIFKKTKEKEYSVPTGEIGKTYIDIKEQTINLFPQGETLRRSSVLIPVIGSALILISFSTSFFFDIEQSIGNIFGASDDFGGPPIAQTLVMNEILPLSSCTSGQTNGQYLELWNGSGVTVNLKDFKLSDGTNTIAIANSNTDLLNGAFAILVKSTGVINQCLGGDVSGAVTVNLGGTIDLNTSLLRLLDASDTVIDTLIWGTGQVLQPTTDQSIERVPTGKDSQTGTNFEPTDLIVKEKYTPGYGTDLLLNEMLPDPSVTFTDEWVEIYNPSGSSINLTGWTLKDIALSARSLTSLGSVNSLGRVVYDDSGDGWLNNSGSETLQLKNPAGKIIDQHTYTGSSPDTSIGRETDGGNIWDTCVIHTKNSSNNGSC